MVHATQMFGVDWLVLPIKWYDIISGTDRTYKLLPGATLASVATIVRLQGLKFSTSTGRRATKYTLTEDTRARILADL